MGRCVCHLQAHHLLLRVCFFCGACGIACSPTFACTCACACAGSALSLLVLIYFYFLLTFSTEVMFRCNFHTAFVPENACLIFTRAELDDAGDDKK